MTDAYLGDEALQTKLAELLCSKLCHDLISPIGAINNGLEFLQDTESGMADDAADLIGGSAKQAAQKLAYFRVAFGAGGAGDSLDFAVVKKLIEELAQEKKFEPLWSEIGQPFAGEISKNFGKLLLNLALLAADCLPRGGQIAFKIPNFPENSGVLVSVSGDRCQLRDDIRSGLEPDLSAEDLTTRNIVGFFCNLLVKSSGKSLILREKSPHSIEFQIS